VGRLCKELWKDRIDPITLVAADDRVFKFRHPIPTERKIEKLSDGVGQCPKMGTHRLPHPIIHFGQLSRELKNKYEANVFIDCTFMPILNPASPARSSSKGIDAYREKGFPNDWKTSPSRGSIGYTGRDYRVGLKRPIRAGNQAFTGILPLPAQNQRTQFWPLPRN